MQTHEDGVERPIGYFSRALTPPETNYAIFDLEVIAAWANVLYFNDILENYKFTLVVDNAAVASLLKNKNLTGRLARAAMVLQQFDFDIKQVGSSTNFFADFASRHAGNTKLASNQLAATIEPNDSPQTSRLTLPVITRRKVMSKNNNNNLRSAQIEDEECLAIVGNIDDPTISRNYIIDDGIVYSIRNGQHRAYVPKKLREEIISMVHDSPFGGHLGVDKVFSKLAARLYWPGMADQIKDYITTCHRCQIGKQIAKKTMGRMGHIETYFPFQKIAIDFIGPIQKSAGYDHIITCVDLYTRFAIARPVTSTSAKVAAKFIVDDVIYNYCVVPSSILSDRGTSFRSSLFSGLLKRLQTLKNFAAL